MKKLFYFSFVGILGLALVTGCQNKNQTQSKVYMIDVASTEKSLRENEELKEGQSLQAYLDQLSAIAPENFPSGKDFLEQSLNIEGTVFTYRLGKNVRKGQLSVQESSDYLATRKAALGFLQEIFGFQSGKPVIHWRGVFDGAKDPESRDDAIDVYISEDKLIFFPAWILPDAIEIFATRMIRKDVPVISK